MTQEKLERRAWNFVATDKSRIPIGSLYASIEWCRAELQKAEVAIIEEIAASIGPTGGWLVSPKTIVDTITERIRKLME